MHYGDLYLGKTTVLAQDTPAFIANRIGVFGYHGPVAHLGGRDGPHRGRRSIKPDRSR